MEELHEVKEGMSDYIRPNVANEIKNLMVKDKYLAIQIYAWLRTQNLKLTDY